MGDAVRARRGSHVYTCLLLGQHDHGEHKSKWVRIRIRPKPPRDIDMDPMGRRYLEVPSWYLFSPVRLNMICVVATLPRNFGHAARAGH